MATSESEPPPEKVGRFVPVALTKPVLAAALGIDGGVVFQILAVENLGLSPSAIGTAFGLGLISLPFQLWAGRMPLRLAKRNVQIFLVLAAVQSAVLACLLAVGATGGFAATALVVTVTAEVTISVLFVTAWQPLLSTRVTTRDRQRINAGWNALGKGLLAGFLLVFSAVEVTGRAFLLVVLSLIAIGAAASLRRITVVDPRILVTSQRKPLKKPLRVSSGMWWILISFTTINLGALPLWLVYLSQVMWPTANLGVIGAIQTICIIAALIGWRTTDGALGRRAIMGVLLILVGSVALIGVGRVADSAGERTAVLIVTVVMTFGMMYASFALLEMAHRLVLDQDRVVRVFTLLDVVDSSSLQIGLFAGGLLVTWSAGVVDWTPYVVFVVTMSMLAVVSVVCTASVTRCGARG